MPRKRVRGDPIRGHQRKTMAARRIGGNNQCACGESRPMALVAGTKPVRCAACLRRERGQSVLDSHHVAGKSNSRVTIPVPVNDHRADLSEAQHDWPRETHENPNGCPLLATAACIRGYVNTSDHLLENLNLRNPEVLERLSPFLIERLGPRWWVGTEFEQFAPKRRNPIAKR